MATCCSSGPPLASCDRPTPLLNLEEDSADSEVDWEAVSGWDSRSDSRAEEDSCGRSSTSSRRDPQGAAPGGAPPPRAPSRAAINLVHLADHLLSRFYQCAVRRTAFHAAGQLCEETALKELYGRTPKDCPQVAHRAGYGKAFARARKALPAKKAYPRFKWGYFVKYARRLGITLGGDAGPMEEPDATAEA